MEDATLRAIYPQMFPPLLSPFGEFPLCLSEARLRVADETDVLG